MKPSLFRATIIAFGLAALCASSIAEAQWVLVARRAIGRVEQMSQQSPQPNGASYDSAAVMIEAPALVLNSVLFHGVPE